VLVLIYTVVALLSLVGLQWPDGVQSTLTVLSATLLLDLVFDTIPCGTGISNLATARIGHFLCHYPMLFTADTTDHLSVNEIQ